MTDCVLCKKPIEPGTKSASVVGGMFPREDPDFFMVDEQVLKESYVHLECLIVAVRGKPNAQRSNSSTG